MLFGSDPPLFSKSAAAAAAASSSSGGSAAAQQQQQQQQQQAAYNGGGAGAQQGDDAFHAQNPLTAGSQAVGGAAAGAAAGAGFTSVWGAALANEPQQTPPPQQQPPQQQQPRPPASAVLPAAAAAAGVGAAAAAAAQQQQQQQSPQMSREAAAQKLSSAFRAAAAATLNRRLQASLTAEAAAAAAEAAEQLQLRGTLRERGERLQAELSALQVRGCGASLIFLTKPNCPAQCHRTCLPRPPASPRTVAPTTHALPCPHTLPPRSRRSAAPSTPSATTWPPPTRSWTGAAVFNVVQHVRCARGVVQAPWAIPCLACLLPTSPAPPASLRPHTHAHMLLPSTHTHAGGCWRTSAWLPRRTTPRSLTPTPSSWVRWRGGGGGREDIWGCVVQCSAVLCQGGLGFVCVALECLTHPCCLLAPAAPAVADPLSQQALEVQAQDLALDDALTALDEALRSGGLELDAYLKQVCV